MRFLSSIMKKLYISHIQGQKSADITPLEATETPMKVCYMRTLRAWYDELVMQTSPFFFRKVSEMSQNIEISFRFWLILSRILQNVPDAFIQIQLKNRHVLPYATCAVNQNHSTSSDRENVQFRHRPCE